MQAPSEALFLAQIVLLLLVGRLMGEAMQRIGQPAVMGQLIAGILLGPSVFGAIWPEAQRAVFAANPQQKSMIDAVSQLGILMLLLLTGMETDLRLVKKARRAAISTSVAGIMRALRLRVRARRVVARRNAAETRPADHHLAVSRYGVVDCLGEDRGDGRARDGFHAPKRRDSADRLGHHRRHGRMGHCLDHPRPRDSRTGSTRSPWRQSVLGTAIFLAASFTLGRRLVFSIIRWTNDNFVSEVPVVTAILIIMGTMALTTHLIGVHTVLGAFVAGILDRRVADPNSPHRRTIAGSRRRPVHAHFLFGLPACTPT